MTGRRCAAVCVPPVTHLRTQWRRACPAVISLAIGRLPHALGVYRRGDRRCPDSLTFLPLAYRLAWAVVAG
jgi:hypothetical protein